MHAFCCDVDRAFIKEGTAIDPIIPKTKTITKITVVIYPRIRPASAMPAPFNDPDECLMFVRAECPHMIAGMPVRGPRQNKLKIPRIRLHIAAAEAVGGRLESVAVG
jgi:hypothetical protein